MQLEIMTPWVRARRVLIAGLSYCMYYAMYKGRSSTRAAQKSEVGCV